MPNTAHRNRVEEAPVVDGERSCVTLVAVHRPLVDKIARTIAARLPAHVDEADLVAAGLRGLMSAAQRFDPDRQVKFSSFAAARIRGAIIDELRSLDWAPRSLRQRARQIERARAELACRLQREPTDDEIARTLCLSDQELQAARAEISNAAMVSLDGERGEGMSPIDSVADAGAVDPANELDYREEQDRLAEAIAALPARQRAVIGLYYYQAITLAEIGGLMGLTEARAAQLRREGILRLRLAMRGSDAVDFVT